MQNNQRIQPLGWGMIGCANGYQFSSEGIDKQLNIAQNYLDLKGDISATLPDPDKKDLSPLFCLSQFEEKGHKILTLAEYHSIKQKGSNRSGTFLGAFIETVDYQFDLSTTKELFDVLRKLCADQYEHFVDHDDNRYREEISGKPFNSPEKELTTIWSKLKPWTGDVVKQENAIYLTCTQDQLPLLFKTIVEVGLIIYFKRIYFSPSKDISLGFKNNNIGIDVIEPSLSEGDTKLRSYLHDTIQRYSQYVHKIRSDKEKIESKLNFVQNEQEKIIQQQIEQRVAPYMQELENMRKEKEQLYASRNLMELGKTVLQEVGNRSKDLNRSDLERFSDSDNINAKLSGIESRLASLSNSISKIKNDQPAITQPVAEESRDTFFILSIVFGLLFVIFFGITMWFTFSAAPEPSQKDIRASEVYKDLDQNNKELHTNIEKLEKEKKQLEDKNNKFKGQLENICSKDITKLKPLTITIEDKVICQSK